MVKELKLEAHSVFFAKLRANLLGLTEESAQSPGLGDTTQ
jgi:hypothetical protein